jgi:glycosyltransferase involved in cell wall biosynthesis
MRLLIISHGHPAFHPGGGELLAHSLYQALRHDDGCEAFFVGFVYPQLLSGRDGQIIFAPNRNDRNDLAIRGNTFDFFMGRHGDPQISDAFAKIIQEIAPDVVHFHHFLMVGLESFRIVRTILPSCKIVLTLHEYWAICANAGQMVRTNGDLCYASSLYHCNACLPDYSPSLFFMREQFIKSFLVTVDRFICPSRFLLDRYQAWGLAPERLELIANGVLSMGNPQRQLLLSISADKANLSHEGRRNRFGFFGQMTRTKGVQVLLKAAKQLHDDGVDFQLGIHGTLALQEKSYREGLEAAFADAADYASFFGAYQPRDTIELMMQYDWIVIPSTWWENAPLVVEEALAARRPIICSNIGGLKEKVTHGRDGLHFRVGDPCCLAETLTRAATDPDLWQTLQSTLRQPISLAECVAHHATLYQSLLD